MKLPLSWIREFIDINVPEHQIAEMLTHLGLEVESYAPKPLNFEKVVVGRVLSAEKHPDADKLKVATVTDGTEQYQVVCGAPNCREGLKTAFALVGAVLQDEEGKSFKVKKGKLRGVESFGMLCSEKELGLGSEHDGIMEFAEQIKEGADIAEIYGDTIFDISLTPNLGHCANVLGVARELSAKSGLSMTFPQIVVLEDRQHAVESEVKVKIEDFDKCPRYSARVIRDVTVKPSPQWLQQRLINCDMRPVNNIVDITNYVLLELGHPLHAFDYDLLEGNEIVVRMGKEGEEFTTLDGKKRILGHGDLLICDQAKPVAIGGVMGGGNSEVGSQTKNVLLEAAYFQPETIRRTSKRLGISTESSRRFERGVDPNGVFAALDRAAMLIQELAGGQVCSGRIDVKKQDFTPKFVTCRLSRINRLLGTQLSVSEVEAIFARLDLPYESDGQDLFTVRIPTFRVDLKQEVDLIEEVARIYGFDNLPKAEMRYTTSELSHSPIYLFEKEIRSRLMMEGLQEFLTCDLIGPTLLGIIEKPSMPEEDMVRVLNPTSLEQSVLRTSLLPGLLQMVKNNFDHQCHDISAFEIGRIHFKKEGQYKEESAAGIVLTGKNRPAHWGEKPNECDFYDMKGIVENLLEETGVENVSFLQSDLPMFHPGRQAAIFVGELKVGSLGEVHPAIVRRLDVPQRIFFAEFDLHDLFRVRTNCPQMEEIPIYPGSSRDLTLTLPEETFVQKILDAIHAIPSKLLEKVIVKDIYRSDTIGKENKNLTLHFFYRDRSKTLSQEAVDAEHSRLREQIKQSLGR